MGKKCQKIKVEKELMMFNKIFIMLWIQKLVANQVSYQKLYFT